MGKLLIISLLSLTTIGCSENHSSVKEENKLEVIESDTSLLVEVVNKYMMQVDSIKPNLDSLQRDIFESAEGGVVKCFYTQSDTLKKEVVYYGETGKRTLEIYQQEGSTVLIKDVKINYTEPISVDKDIETSDLVENVYYLDGKQNLIYWIKDNQVMPPSLYEKQEIIKE